MGKLLGLCGLSGVITGKPDVEAAIFLRDKESTRREHDRRLVLGNQRRSAYVRTARESGARDLDGIDHSAQARVEEAPRRNRFGLVPCLDSGDRDRWRRR